MPGDARTARPWMQELWALGVPAAATALAGALFGQRSPTDVAMVYLLGIVTVSLRFRFWTGIANAILSVLLLDVLFVPPYFTLSVQQMQHVVTFGVMLLVAIVVGRLMQRISGQVALVRQSEQRTALLHAMARDLSRTDDPEELARLAVRHVERRLDARVVLRTNAAGAAAVADEAAAEPVADGAYRLELRAATAPSSPLGSLTLFPRDPARLRDPEERRLAKAFANQLAVALERARLAREAARARVQIETERLRSTLLSAISHDLRTPLAVMKGAASTLAEAAGTLSEPARAELCDTLLEETARLERLVTNTLEMTRLEAGAPILSREPQSVEELVGGAFARTEHLLEGRPIQVQVPGDLFCAGDPGLLEQLLVNLLENAARHTPPGTELTVTAGRADGEVHLTVADRGPGLGRDELERVFEKFYRGGRRAGGVGLGLALCRAIAAAHGGSIDARERPGGGAAFTVRLPLAEPDAGAPLEEVPLPAGGEA